MILTPPIDTLCTLLSQEKPSWGKIQERYNQLPSNIIAAPRLLQQYTQDFSEIYLDLIIENIANQAMSQEIELFRDYARSKINKKDALFRSNGNRIILKSKTHGLWEYDQIIKVAQTPVILEMKLRAWDKGKIRKRRQADGSYTLEKGTCTKNNLRPDLYQRKLNPIEDFFGTAVGYIIIISKDQYQKITQDTVDPTVTQFVQNNGKIVPFYTDRITFKNEVAKKAQEWGYQIKPEPLQHTKYFQNQPSQKIE